MAWGEAAGDRLEENLNRVGRLFYAASTFICTPNSLCQEVGLGLGAQAGESRLREVFLEAGFTRFRRATATPFNLFLRPGNRGEFPALRCAWLVYPRIESTDVDGFWLLANVGDSGSLKPHHRARAEGSTLASPQSGYSPVGSAAGRAHRYIQIVKLDSCWRWRARLSVRVDFHDRPIALGSHDASDLVPR
jgi:hypothetical protein